MKVTFLGTGTSVGVPRIACQCPVCTSADPHNKRLRCSILVEQGGKCVLVDTTPDLRTQALRADLRRLDALLFTHAHADHLHGLDDVRSFCALREQPLPCYGAPETLARIRIVFDYAFRDHNPSSVPSLDLRPVREPFRAAGIPITPLPLLHGDLPVLGFRVGGFAYLTDCSAVPSETHALLQNLDVLVLDALRDSPHPTHLSLTEAIAVARHLAPARTLFTHIAHDLDHRSTNARLPADMALAHDGLCLDMEDAI